MMYGEFEELAGMEISFEDYDKVIEPMYIASNMDKRDFVEFIKPSVRPMAKKYKEAKQKASERPVFIGDGRQTPNHCYYLGEWAILVGTQLNLRTGIITYKVRKITVEEQKATGWDNYLSSHVDINQCDEFVNIKWIG